ncbi:DNA repair protein RecO [Vulgatibacter sp.]|uniref:DNA repair protein RecO n=1 Tax=Vulgatibacter sp. TaxID=1971226 RepID=UPI003562A659
MAGVRPGDFSGEAIVLSCLDYGDSDRVVTLLTRERGKLGAFAAGARKSKRRFAGALEPFTVLRVELAERRGDLLFFSSCMVEEAHAGLRFDLARLGHAGHAAELCRELCKERVAHEELYDALRAYLGQLAVREADPAALLAFELAALEHVGLSPRLSDCTICGGPVEGTILFDPPHGGAVCGSCTSMAFAGAVRVEAPVREAMEALQQAPPFAASIAEPQLRARVRNLVRRFTHQVLGRNPRSLDFLAQVGIEG